MESNTKIDTPHNKCPDCRGTMAPIGHEFICQSACGFRSTSSDPRDWVILNGLVNSYQAIERFALEYAAASPGSNIINDFLTCIGKLNR